MSEVATIILASASPRRCTLLEQIRVTFRQQVTNIDETPRAGETPAMYVRRLALEKARAVRAAPDSGGLPVLGADTAVVVNDRILGKPGNDEMAADMLHMLSGRCHQVLTAVSLVAGAREAVRLSTTRVWFRPLSERDIRAYLGCGEAVDKAGAYAIQGLGALFVERLDGSYSGVMGLPLLETADLLLQFNIAVLGPEP